MKAIRYRKRPTGRSEEFGRAHRRPVGERAFTLIEIVATLALVSIVGVMVAVYLSILPQSAQPVQMTRTLFELSQAMEKITSDYRKQICHQLSSFTLGSFYSAIDVSALAANGISAERRYVLFDSTGAEQGCASNCRYLDIRLTKSGQSVRAVFSE